MRRFFWPGIAPGIAVALTSLLLAGCVESVANPADTQDLLRTGQVRLACREPCLAEWRQSQPQAAQLDATGRWLDQAALIMRIGYQDDLSLYYLGHAAEGLGYPGAAAGYYRQSIAVSQTAGSCAALSHLCGRVPLPQTAMERVAMIDRALPHPPPPRRPARPMAPPGPTTPATAPTPASAVVPLDEPGPAPVEATPQPPFIPSAPPAAPPRTAPAPASEYIEPPPAH